MRRRYTIGRARSEASPNIRSFGDARLMRVGFLACLWLAAYRHRRKRSRDPNQLANHARLQQREATR
jgi:hypothetical protein